MSIPSGRSGPLVLNAISFLDRGPFSLTVKPGEICGLWGDSGVGKSCLLRSVADLDDHSGSVELAGVSAQSVLPPEWRKQVGYLPAESGWWADRVRDHFAMDDPELMVAVQRLGLQRADLEKEVGVLSTGERQRLAVIRLLLNRPSVLLLDEPSANLDESSVSRVESLILDYVQRESCPVIWVGHDRSQLHRVADRVLQLTISGFVHGD